MSVVLSPKTILVTLLSRGGDQCKAGNHPSVARQNKNNTHSTMNEAGQQHTEVAKLQW